MGLQSVEKSALIKTNNLDPNQYTASLLKEAYRIGLVDRSMIDSIQMQIVLILKDLILRYTKGESTSVTVETAERILNSIYYSVDACIKGFSSPKASIDALKEKNIKEIYEEGIKVVKSCLDEAKLLYEEVSKNKLGIPLIAYNVTIDNAIPGFFKNYGIVFNAHDTMADIDYPLAFDDMSIRGAFYIKQYIEKLNMETQFCNCFKREDIERILQGYGNIYNIDYREALINIFQILLSNSVFSVMSEGNGNSLFISKRQYEFLDIKLRNLNHYQLNTLVNESFEKAIEDLRINQSNLIEYINRFKVEFKDRVVNAVENRSLHNLIITGDIKNPAGNSIIFEEGVKMTDETFRDMIDRIIRCTSINDKASILTSSIDSSEDFIDALQADCLFGNEYDAVFSMLSDIELSIVGRKVFGEELRNGRLDLSRMLFREKETEYEWQYRYIQFLHGLSKDRIKSIESLINL